jgi:hypothetical protein
VCRNPKILFPLLESPWSLSVAEVLPPCCLNDKYSTEHDITHPVEQYYAEICTNLEEQGTPIGGNDLLIAAHALTCNLTLVTANVREFSRLPHLKVENWLN